MLYIHLIFSLLLATFANAQTANTAPTEYKGFHVGEEIIVHGNEYDIKYKIVRFLPKTEQVYVQVDGDNTQYLKFISDLEKPTNCKQSGEQKICLGDRVTVKSDHDYVGEVIDMKAPSNQNIGVRPDGTDGNRVVPLNMITKVEPAVSKPSAPKTPWRNNTPDETSPGGSR